MVSCTNASLWIDVYENKLVSISFLQLCDRSAIWVRCLTLSLCRARSPTMCTMHSGLLLVCADLGVRGAPFFVKQEAYSPYWLYTKTKTRVYKRSQRKQQKEKL